VPEGRREVPSLGCIEGWCVGSVVGPPATHSTRGPVTPPATSTGRHTHHPSQCRGCQGANPLQRCHQAHSTWMRTQPTTHRPQPRPTGGWLSLIHTNGNVLAPDGQAWHPDGTCWALMAPDGRPTAIMGDPQQCWEVHSGPSRPTRPGMGPIQIRWATPPAQAGRDGPRLHMMGTWWHLMYSHGNVMGRGRRRWPRCSLDGLWWPTHSGDGAPIRTHSYPTCGDGRPHRPISGPHSLG